MTYQVRQQVEQDTPLTAGNLVSSNDPHRVYFVKWETNSISGAF